ncbi:hypothetical protein MRB53_012599 [Persea americana]|uniref:Uncharacterized protein n=1 Tax=Persea americana TaxID=3435 RepID=A0ACC2LY39_PERAE|nr:hypothetical protein MRB53_012599 [Persea americana]
MTAQLGICVLTTGHDSIEVLGACDINFGRQFGELLFWEEEMWTQNNEILQDPFKEKNRSNISHTYSKE